MLWPAVVLKEVAPAEATALPPAPAVPALPLITSPPSPSVGEPEEGPFAVAVAKTAPCPVRPNVAVAFPPIPPFPFCALPPVPPLADELPLRLSTLELGAKLNSQSALP